MQGIGFAIVGAIQRLLRVGIYSDNNFYDEMAFDYGDMSAELFDTVYGKDWYEKHGEKLREAFVRQANHKKGA